MKVLFINQSRNLGGAEKLMARLIENSISENVLAYGSPMFIDELGIKKYGNIKKYRSRYLGKINRRKDKFWFITFIITFFGAVKEVFRIIRSEKINIIHANNYTSVIYAIIPSIINRVPIIWHCHDTIEHNKIERAIKKILSKFTYLIIAVSNNVKNHLITIGVKFSKIQVVYNGIILENYKAEERIEAILEKDDKQRYIKIITAVAAFTENKGIHNVLLALAKIKETKVDIFNKIKFYILGDRNNNINNYVEYLDSIIQKNDLMNTVKFLGWADNTLSVISNMDICIIPSIYNEAFSLIVAEAMSTSKVVISSNIGGLPELIQDKYNGFLYTAIDVRELSDLMIYAVLNINKLDDIRKHAYEVSVKRFTIDRMVKEINDVYELVLHKN